MPTEPEPNAFEGWTLRQALELTAAPQAWNEWLAAKVAYDKIQTSVTSSVGRSLSPSPGLVTKHRLQALQCRNSVVQSFRELMATGTLVAVGSHGERSQQPTPIHRDNWRTLKAINFERSNARGTGAAKTRIYNIRVVPLVHAPDAVDRLRGQSIGNAFLTSVIRDPEVIAASKRCSEPNRHRLVFEEGQYPGPVVQYLWPIDLNTKDLAWDFIRTGMFFIDDPIPKPPADIVRVAEIMVDRWRRLIRRLLDGELAARGTYALNGELQFIDSFQWARRTLQIDVQNSDLVDRDNGKDVVRWSGIALVSPESLQRASQLRSASSGYLESRPKAQTNRRRPISEAVAAALTARKLGNHPGGRSWKELAGLIAADMPRYPQTEAAWNALAKAIKRHYANQEGRKA